MPSLQASSAVAQPLAAAGPSEDTSQERAGFKEPQCDPGKPTCPQSGLIVPDHKVPTLPPSVSRLQGSSSSVHSSRMKSSRSRGSVADSKQPATTTSDSWYQLLLACLWCQCSALVLGLLEACSPCLNALCSFCCGACARCCSAIEEAPVEELSCHAHCHSVLFQSCCEPTECLEFCLECCEICHRS
ncbi:myoD family inhibitor domain-containing protein-like isoform X2 [Channa argus]|uniref:myoD family inhibitor domain-containing protein-like isoform X2 n=1 Tax=Channa argus TaxID=215402 RepID=UPI0035228D2C